MRHPSFLGLRKDKPAASVVRELPKRVEQVAPTESRSKGKKPDRAAHRRR